MQPFRVCFNLGMSFVDVEASVRMETRKSFKYFLQREKIRSHHFKYGGWTRGIVRERYQPYF